MDYASSGGLYWATGTYSLTYVFKPRLCGRHNSERDHAFSAGINPSSACRAECTFSEKETLLHKSGEARSSSYAARIRLAGSGLGMPWTL